MKSYLERLHRPIELIATLDGSPASRELQALLADVAACSARVAVVERDDGERAPSFAIAAAGEPPRVRFAGLPMGHEFTSLVLALLQVGGHPPKLEAELIDQIRALDGDYSFETCMSLSCQNCPDVVQALNILTALNPRIHHVAIDSALFQDEVAQLVSVQATDGPKFATALEQHVRQYAVDVMNAQRAVSLVAGELLEVTLASGATSRSKAVVLATGARWREINVPGEQLYRNRGVAYCPHCDGPLFKGKRVAVIGGGNSGVEAAIDLAGLAAEVTLIEYADTLRADAVLVAKLRSLAHVRIVTGAQTTEITGDGSKVNGLRFTDRASGIAHQVALEGVFVQIGLVPNTEWLKGAIDLSRHGEIMVDAKGQTSLPGVFAAGDATTVPFKQIVIAVGDGARAALGAFDHLIRLPAAEMLA